MVQDFLSWLGFGILMKHGVCLQDVSDRVGKISSVHRKYRKVLRTYSETKQQSCYFDSLWHKFAIIGDYNASFS